MTPLPDCAAVGKPTSGPKRGQRFTVRKQSSGYTFRESFYVWDLQRKGRVSVHASTRECAQADADGLNERIGWDLPS